MGTHILQVLSLGKGKKGGGDWTNVTHRRVAAHSSRHTGDQHTSPSQPTKCFLEGGDAPASQHPTLGVHAALGEMPWGAETGRTEKHPPFWLSKDSRVVTCPEISGLTCISRARGETNGNTSSENPHLWYGSC